MDCRSLAAFRMALALVLFADLIVAATNMTAFYADEGVLPRQVLLEHSRLSSDRWSLYLVSDARFYMAALLTVAAAAALSLLAGYRTRLMTVLSWVLLCSLQARNPLVVNAGDAVLRVLLFWSMLLPLGRVWSLDAQLAREGRLPPAREPAWLASWAILLQLAMVYWFTAALKTDPIWHEEGTAIYYALKAELFTRPFGAWLAGHEAFCRLLTHATLWIEAFGPCLIFLPFWNGPARLLAFGLFAALHLSIALTMTLGLFCQTMLAGWLLVLPACFWDHVERWARRPSLRSSVWACQLFGLATGAWERLRRLARRGHPPQSAAVSSLPAPMARWRPPLQASFTIFCLGYVLLWNLRAGDPAGWRKCLPATASWIGYTLRLEQRWGMFAPKPLVRHGWPVLEARLADGSSVDLIRPEAPLDWSKPASVGSVSPDIKWRKLFSTVLQRDFAYERPCLASYFCRRWNEAHPPAGQVVAYQYWSMSEKTPPPGEPRAGVQRSLLWRNDHYGAPREAPVPPPTPAEGRLPSS